MKRGVAIFFTVIFSLNVIGYYGLYVGLVHRADLKANRTIDDNTYDRAQTITIKIPLSLPYPIQGEFERISGDFEYKGEFFKLVEQKYENDTVYVVCLRNIEKKQAQSVLNDLVKQSTDQSPSSQTAKTLVGLIKDYNPVTVEIDLQSPAALDEIKPTTLAANELLKLELPVPTPPPNRIC